METTTANTGGCRACGPWYACDAHTPPPAPPRAYPPDCDPGSAEWCGECLRCARERQADDDAADDAACWTVGPDLSPCLKCALGRHDECYGRCDCGADPHFPAQ